MAVYDPNDHLGLRHALAPGVGGRWLLCGPKRTAKHVDATPGMAVNCPACKKALDAQGAAR